MPTQLSEQKNTVIIESSSTKSADSVTLSKTDLKKIANTWINYFLENPAKLFIIEQDFPNFNVPLELIKQARGFQITAFAGKAQNEATHPNKLPDLGELNLLCKLRAIQILVNKPVQIIMDGEHYAPIFKENLQVIKQYERKLEEFGAIVGLNTEFSRQKTFLNVQELMEETDWDLDKVQNRFELLKKNPEWSYRRLDLYPHDLISSVKNFAPNAHDQSNEQLLAMATDFVIMKSILVDIIKDKQKLNGFQRITILKYSKTHNPRLNIEMNVTPWNSTVLFKKTFVNINTATSSPYQILLKDPRNRPIYLEDGTFLGFTRNKNIFAK